MRARWTLEAKFALLTSAVIVVGSLVANALILRNYRDQLLREAEDRAVVLTEATAISFTNTLLYEELDLVEEGGLLENYIEVLLADANTDVTGVTVWNTTGQVLATDDYDLYLRKPTPEDLSRLQIVRKTLLSKTEDEKGLVVFTPLHIGSKRFGTLRIDFTLENEWAQLAAFRRRLLAITVAAAMAGILLAFLAGRALASPIKRLASEMRKVKPPDFASDLHPTRRDEIGEWEVGFLQMLDRLRQAAREREEQQRALIQAEKLASLGTLVAGLTHEINNPLAGIRACLRRLRERPEDEAQTRQYAELMDEAFDRIERIVRNLLDFARRRDAVLVPVNLNQVAERACSFVEYKASRQDVSLTCQLDEELPRVLGDRQQIEQVVVNLLLNALDAVGQAGHVTVRTWAENASVCLEVSDSGPGIPAEIRDKIFDPFFSTKPVGQGTGLGLAVARSIVEEHRGRIDFSSSERGTTFTLSFPPSQDAEPQQCPLAAAVLAGGSQRSLDKALFEFGGKPLVARTLDLLKCCFPNVMIISTTPERFTELGYPVHTDLFPDCGPLGGIHAALSHSPSGHTLVVACDLPFLSEDLIQFLCENGVGYDALVLESESGVEPLCAIYSRKCLPVIEAQIRAGNYKVQDVFDKVRTRRVRISSDDAFYASELFLNVNTAEDLRRAEDIELQRRGSGSRNQDAASDLSGETVHHFQDRGAASRDEDPDC